MDYAHYEIGTRHDANGDPLILADGKIVGTVAEVKALIARYEEACAARSDSRFLGLPDHMMTATIADVRNMIAENNRSLSKHYLNGGSSR